MAGADKTDKAADARLVEAVRAGDKRAFREIVDRHKDLVYRITFRMTGDRDAASDLSQDVFLRAFTSLRRLKDSSSFRSWLISIAVNRCRDHLKDVRRTVQSLDGEPVADESLFSGSIVNPYRGAERAELGAALEKALGLLGPIYREAVILKDVEGFSYEEMTEMTGEAASNMKIRVVRGREALRKIIERWKVR